MVAIYGIYYNSAFCHAKIIHNMHKVSKHMFLGTRKLLKTLSRGLRIFKYLKTQDGIQNDRHGFYYYSSAVSIVQASSNYSFSGASKFCSDKGQFEMCVQVE